LSFIRGEASPQNWSKSQSQNFKTSSPTPKTDSSSIKLSWSSLSLRSKTQCHASSCYTNSRNKRSRRPSPNVSCLDTSSNPSSPTRHWTNGPRKHSLPTLSHVSLKMKTSFNSKLPSQCVSYLTWWVPRLTSRVRSKCWFSLHRMRVSLFTSSLRCE
jgi:hypothetical protein